MELLDSFVTGFTTVERFGNGKYLKWYINLKNHLF